MGNISHSHGLWIIDTIYNLQNCSVRYTYPYTASALYGVYVYAYLEQAIAALIAIRKLQYNNTVFKTFMWRKNRHVWKKNRHKEKQNLAKYVSIK